MRTFVIIWLGQFFSSIGSGLTAFALGIYVYQTTGSATGYSSVMMLAFLPSVLLRPIGGVVTDMIGTRLAMLIGDIGSAGSILLILLLMHAGGGSMGAIYLGVTLNSVFLALQNPAYRASISELVNQEDYSKASGLVQLAESSRYLISPIVAGILMSWYEVEFVLIMDALSYIFAACTICAMKRKYLSSERHSLADFVNNMIVGFRYTLSHHDLLCFLGTISLITFFVGFLQALLGPMILSFTDPSSLGKIQSFSASGMVISSLLIGIFSQSNNQQRILFVSLAISGVFYAILGVSTTPFNLTLAGFMFFCTLPFINTSLEVMIRSNTDDSMQGRVWSIVSLISQLGMILALGIAGPLADWVFNPMLQPHGILASSLGHWIGTGDGRGIGLIFLLCGTGTILTSLLFIPKATEMKNLSLNQNG